MFSYLSFRSISRATVTPSFVITGEPYFLPRITFRPFGPSVTRTTFARVFTPFSIACRASSLNFNSFAGTLVSPQLTVDFRLPIRFMTRDSPLAKIGKRESKMLFGGSLQIIHYRQKRGDESCPIALGPLVSRAVQTLARLVSLALQLRAQLIKARLNLEQFLFASFRARLELFDVARLETGFSNLRRFFSVTIQMNAAATPKSKPSLSTSVRFLCTSRPFL